ncbi:GDP-mannose 4-6-dehydratase [Apiospora saccharicola]
MSSVSPQRQNAMEQVKQGNKVLVTGITGQIGSYLTEYLVAQGREVHGIIRDPASLLKNEYREIYNGVQLHFADIEDRKSLLKIIRETRPDEVYHLAARSHVSQSWEQPIQSFDVNVSGFMNVLEAIREAGLGSITRILVVSSPETILAFLTSTLDAAAIAVQSIDAVQAGSAEMFGQAPRLPINEETIIAPQTPYGVSKAACFWLARCWRRQYSMFVTTAILFNHESYRRAVARVVLRKQNVVEVGSLDYLRDWGHVTDGVDCMVRALQHSEADDYIVATGESHTPRQFIQLGFKSLSKTISWEGTGVNEVGIITETGDIVVRVKNDGQYHLPASHTGDSSKAKEVLGWKASKSFEDLNLAAS